MTLFKLNVIDHNLLLSGIRIHMLRVFLNHAYRFIIQILLSMMAVPIILITNSPMLKHNYYINRNKIESY